MGKGKNEKLASKEEALGMDPNQSISGLSNNKLSHTSEKHHKRKREDEKLNGQQSEQKRSGSKSEVGAPTSKKSKHTRFTWEYKEHPKVTSMTNEALDAYYQQHSITVKSDTVFRPVLQFEHCALPKEWAHHCFQGFSRPTPIQSVVWPILFRERDVVAIAETGSGKTLGFGIPAMVHVLRQRSQGQRLDDGAQAGKHPAAHLSFKDMKNKGKGGKAVPRVLVLLPTRELAMQVHEVFERIGQFYQIHSVCLLGGLPKAQQRSQLKDNHVEVVLATPGRLLDFMAEEDTLDVSEVSLLILDESDRMLDLGFEKELQRIVACVTRPHYTWMFSATWPNSIQSFASTFLNKSAEGRPPVHVTLGHASLNASSTVTQHVHVLDDTSMKMPLLFKLLQSILKATPTPTASTGTSTSSKPKLLVFALYKKETERVYQQIQAKGYKVAAIHGDLSQSARIHALEQFKQGQMQVLVATDVAARGLDIPKVHAVINVTFPLTIEDYIHRIGRTGRAGQPGIAHTFFTVNEKAHAGALIQVLKQTQQEVPESLFRFGTTIKKKEHSAYGAFYKEIDATAKSTKIVFESDEE